jgi:hypothetical protein
MYTRIRGWRWRRGPRKLDRQAKAPMTFPLEREHHDRGRFSQDAELERDQAGGELGSGRWEIRTTVGRMSITVVKSCLMTP